MADLTRIRSNIQALTVLRGLRQVNNRVGVHQLRLATGKRIRFKQEKDRLIFKGLPKKPPDRVAGVTIIKLEFAARPRQVLGAGCVVL